MTPEALALARDGDSTATVASVTLWGSIVGDSTVDPPIPTRVKAEPAGAALDSVAQYVGSGTSVPNHTLREVVFRTGAYLQRSAALLGFHGPIGEGMPQGDPRVGGYSALRRSGAMALLEPHRVHRAGLI